LDLSLQKTSGIRIVMGIKFYCPNGHKMHVKGFLAGKKGLCPKCGVRVEIPTQSVATPPTQLEISSPVAVGNELSLDAPQPKMASRPSREPVFGFPAEGPAVDDISAETVGEEESPAISLAPPKAVEQADLDSDSSAGVMDIEIDVPMPAADPLQVPAAGAWYVHLPTGKQLGPVGSDTVREWLDQARIGVDALVWREGWAEWRTVRDAFSTVKSLVPATEMASANGVEAPGRGRVETTDLLGQPPGYRRPRSKERFNFTTSLFLLGMAVLLFVLLLFVFFNRKQPAKVSSTGIRVLLALRDTRSTAADFS
jgi:GYF domain 2